MTHKRRVPFDRIKTESRENKAMEAKLSQEWSQSLLLQEEPRITSYNFKRIYKELTHRQRDSTFQNGCQGQSMEAFSQGVASLTMVREEESSNAGGWQPRKNYNKFERILKVRQKIGVFRTINNESAGADTTPSEDYNLMRIKSEGEEAVEG